MEYNNSNNNSNSYPVDKYLIFIDLEAFPFFNIPPFSSSRETLTMLTTSFPERLGKREKF